MSVGKIVGDHKYRIECPIARGAFSTVYRCEEISTGKVYAVKVVNKALAEANNMRGALVREINAMEVVASSKYLVNLVDKLVSARNYYLVMDYVEGGTLLDFIRETRLTASSQWTRRLFRQLLNGIERLHEANVVHRDIKPENILLNKERTQLMISDFGFACCAPPGRLLHRPCGTLKYCAPELLVRCPEYDGRKVDIWAAGVTLYVMLFGEHPFKGDEKNVDTLVESIMSGKYSFPTPVSPDLEHLFSVMLHPIPSKRWSVKKLLRHAWVLGAHNNGVGSVLNCISISKTISEINEGEKRGLVERSYLVRSPLAKMLKEDDSDLSTRQCRSCPVLHKELNYKNTPDEYRGLSEYSDTDSNGTSSDATERVGEERHSYCESLQCGLRSNSNSISATSFTPNSSISSTISSSDSSLMNEDDSPVTHKHDFMCTLRVVVNFFLFCTALVIVGGMRLLFDVDFNDLPIPSIIRSSVEDLLIPPHERPSQRSEVHRLRHHFLGARVRQMFASVEKAIDKSAWRNRIVPGKASTDRLDQQLPLQSQKKENKEE
ncbi:Small Surface Antigen [Trypanosoma theileri]|uniref:Small Surface Antigen n=1 Tax=Trypanosoma theileri TaxID=67003 RepID=A0A1X0NRF6_9TRYP|nr:Small Surface Antigen [Trypanosoma theileri]ORC87073.1 Small Surface Antigen [Trypanosoma theileri]